MQSLGAHFHSCCVYPDNSSHFNLHEFANFARQGGFTHHHMYSNTIHPILSKLGSQKIHSTAEQHIQIAQMQGKTKLESSWQSKICSLHTETHCHNLLQEPPSIKQR